MRYLCRRSHWHMTADDRDQCNNGFGINDFEAYAPIPPDLTPDVAPMREDSEGSLET